MAVYGPLFNATATTNLHKLIKLLQQQKHEKTKCDLIFRF